LPAWIGSSIECLDLYVRKCYTCANVLLVV
jgi:hypothetical protein